MSNFKQLNLNPQIISALEKKGYTHPTPIQLQAIPHVLEHKDLLGIAQTGTGKTAAFALPILHNLFASGNAVQPSNVRTLILTPTRELATQINDNIKLYGKDLHLKSTVVFGGVNINNQIKAAKNGVDILIATPGRLLDLIKQNVIKFSQLEIFVLDEADRMLDMGFINDVKKIITKIPKQRQTLFFSATMPKDITVLANSILNDPVRIEVTPESTTVEKIDQRLNLVDKAHKSLLLKSIIKKESDDSLFLVFSKTKHKANRIVEFLDNHNIKTAAIHGNKSQVAREKALEAFRSGEIKVLVATDIAARGIDIVGITHVINYELPNHPESYVHRIGRTARAGREGIAISFCDNSESSLLKDIEKTIKMKLPIDETHAYHGVKPSAAEKSALPAKERPKSSYKSDAKPRDGAKRSSSNFAESKKWPTDREEGSSKSEFGNKSRSPRNNSDFEGNSENYGNRPKSRFAAEGKPRFNSDANERPRFNKGAAFSEDDRPRRQNFGDRKPFGAERGDGNNERPAFRNSSFNKSSGDRFGNERSDDRGFRSSDKFSKPRFGGDDSRPARSRFNSDDSRSSRSRFDSDDSRPARPRFNSDDSRPRSRFGDDSRSVKSNFGDDRRSKFNSDEPRDYSRPKRDFGDRQFGNRSSFGNEGSRDRGFEGRKSSSSFGESSGERKPRFGDNRQRNEGERKFGNSEGRSFSGNRSGNSSKSFGGGFGNKSGGFNNKPGNGGGRKPSRPKNF